MAKDETALAPEESGEAPEELTLDPVTAELAQTKEQLLCLAAEYDNFRKRSQREREEAFAFAKAEVLKAFLPVLDNFERASGAAETSLEDYRRGVAMILEQLGAVIAKQGAEGFGAAGEPFDPALHNAVMHVENPALGASCIAEVLSRGYRLGNRVIREATVVVAN
ncbi:MAG: nucleotide exchange factor GrpE [Oscillospiraceae bacterium]|jgi:molecular chaperone GrpE|nr:nucleotide exchange factor GrpE [Oscillospiraceae bacterium]